MAIAKTLLTKYKVDTAGAEKGLSNIVGVATKAATALAGVAAGTFAIAKSTANYRDETTKLARQVGLSTKEMSRLRHASEQAGLQMNDLTRVMGTLNDDTGKSADILRDLGITMEDVNGKSTNNRTAHLIFNTPKRLS